jgi:eukaryotic-like serine/threonine-protein kinase
MPTWNPRANELFLKALEIGPAGERREYLEGVCAGDAVLRAEVEALLEASAQAGGFLDSPAPQLVASADEPAIRERPGTVIGPYKLLEQIGEGGFGVVFMAEQTRPVRRKVALKVLKPGMDTKQVVARFEAERQALALMDHPNIARVFDGGATPSGHPYFVMELVRGVPITEFCDENHLTPAQRLELFVPVCQAVQHSHHKGIIHRDLKPSNVLVTMHDTTPVVKVIDFGVAKPMGQTLTDKTLFTGFAQLVGTPLYMSPEQAGQSGLDVDTRTDIYALGVLLYELLTGLTPFDGERMRTVGFDEMRRIIREEEPPKPSTRISTLGKAADTVSSNRRTDPKRLSELMRGELDWVVMKALEKDRSRRYDTASAFAADVRRYLADEPVLACPPSAGYRLRKFARRNRAAVTTACLVVLALAGGLAGTTWGLLRAEWHREVAETNHQKALGAAAAELAAKEDAQGSEAETRAVLDFVEQRIFAAARPRRQSGGLGRDVSLRQAIESALPGVEAGFADQPLIEARLRMTLGVSFANLGDAKMAEAQCRRARELYTARHGADHPKTLQSMNNLALCYAALGRHDAALELREKTLARMKDKLGADHADTLRAMNNLANSYFALGRHPKALKLREEVLRLEKDKLGHDHRETLRAMNNLANSYMELDRLPEALELYEKTLSLQTDKLRADDVDLLTTMMNLTTCLGRLGRDKESLPLQEKTLRLKTAKLGPDHPDTLSSRLNLGATLARLGRHTESLPLLEETLRLLVGKHGLDHPHTLMCRANVAYNLIDLGRDDEALPLLDEFLRRVPGKVIDPREVADQRLRISQRKKDAAGCRATAEQWEKLGRTGAADLYTAARLRAVAAAVGRRDPTLANEEADRAMGWLRKAVAAGYRDAERLRSDSDLAALRDRDDFKKLLAGLEAGANGDR